MPLFYQQNINDFTRLAIWKIEEPEAFFLKKVPLHREITHPNKRLQHLAGRYLLPYLFTDFPSHDIEIAETRKPFLASEKYHFSISHCGGYAAALVSKRQRVGVDIEYITDRLFKISHKFLHADELHFVFSFRPQSEQLTLLSILWSAKEAMYKWYGNGEVDFKDMMRMRPFLPAVRGEISASFINEKLHQELLLHYLSIDDLTLVWVAS